MIEAGIFTLLSTNAGIVAICETRVYPIVLPRQPTYPAIAYKTVGGSQNPTFTTRGMQRLRLEVICEAQSGLVMVNLANAVIAALNGYQGTLSDGTIIQNCEKLQTMDGYDRDALVYRRMIEFYLYFT